MSSNGSALNYAHLAGWNSQAFPAVFLTAAIVLTILTIRNRFFFAKTAHTRTVYTPLLAWGILRMIGMAMRVNIVQGDNGQNLGYYKAAQIVGNIGYFPLSISLVLNTIESITIVFKLQPSTSKKFKLGAFIYFFLSVICLVVFAFDYIINYPLGYVLNSTDAILVLREIGTAGLISLSGITLITVIYVGVSIERANHVYPAHRRGLQLLMVVLLLQSALLFVKLAFTEFRNWNPKTDTDEAYYFCIQVLPEYLYMLFLASHRVKRVFDDIELSENVDLKDMTPGNFALAQQE
ncbi:hypothetical protein HDU82_007725 [Entophlyctis luteolus]|nr:hypothetical protein HDU82_007725 [Entophlyctis luteolus]